MNAITIAEVRPFTFGGAARLLWVSPEAADHVIIMRKVTNDISGIADPGATVAYRGLGRQAGEFRSVFLPDDVAASDLYRSVLDDVTGWNTTLYYAFYASNAAETDVSTAFVLAATFSQVGTFEELDVIGALMPFIQSYLGQQIQTGALQVPNGVTTIDVLDGPPLLDALTFPLVSLHLDDDRPVGFALGDSVGDLDELGDTVVARRGLISNIVVSVVGVTPNPEVRRHLYRLLKGALIAARQMLEQRGLANMEVTGRFSEDFVNYDMPLFSAELVLRGSLLSAVMIPDSVGIISEIDVNEGVLTAQAIDP